MRTLTVKRRKTFVGCLMKMKLYIKDEQGELVIDGVPCRKLGELKNGEEQSFSIGEEETAIYVVADKLSKDYCNDGFVIPAGTEEVSVSGKNRFDPMMGNPFCFDGQTKEQLKQKRKKKKGKGAMVLLICIAAGIVVGIPLGRLAGNAMVKQMNSLDGAPKTFTAQEMRITLTEDFTQQENETFTACYVAKNVGIMVLREDFELAAEFGDYSLEEYGELVIQANGITGAQLQSENGLTYFDFQNTSTENGEIYQYFSVVYKSDGAFWLVQFGTLPDLAEQYTPQFKEWAQSVQFGNA